MEKTLKCMRLAKYWVFEMIASSAVDRRMPVFTILWNDLHGLIILICMTMNILHLQL